VRLLVVLAGLPERNLDVGIADEWLARPDLVYPQWRVVVEYDGRHHDLSSRRDDDVLRRERLEPRWRVIVVRRWHLHRPRQVALRVHAALAERGYRGPGPVFGPEWCRLFEAHRP